MFTTQVRELLSALLWDPIEERFVPSRPLPPSSHSLLLLTTLLLRPTAPHYHHSLPPLTTTTHYHYYLLVLLLLLRSEQAAGIEQRRAPSLLRPHTERWRLRPRRLDEMARDGKHPLHRCTVFTAAPPSPTAPRVHLCTCAPLHRFLYLLSLCNSAPSTPLRLCTSAGEQSARCDLPLRRAWPTLRDGTHRTLQPLPQPQPQPQP
jgi:hypothetical protein